ncbi:MAG: helix-turn-helix domain-containing protein [Candidatus Thiodiazotropha sp. (ex Lucinoma kastoroae)]|nr:helix-turn-helix domain-containing protein [Candidatus Thiodiazotropha sp. (ex Rostrolucina anterorostrata)]MCU7848664.1 helix-turn-helix domain-containing protein [Candidatus Thiodiazotropha sp. (ex Lucinoma kastoroae)]
MKIGLLLYPNCMPAGLFAFADLVESANKRFDRNFFELFWVATDLQPVQCSHGNILTAQSRLGDDELDALLVPGLWSDDDITTIIERHQALIAAIGRLEPNTALWSYCTGVSLIAATGRLSGYKATITWWMAESVQQLFPTVDWQLSRTCVFDDHFYTASGANGYLPICLEIIERELGEQIMREITKFMVLPRPERGYLPFQSVDLVYLDDKLMRRVYLWVENTPARSLVNTNLAQYLNMSERSVARKVKEAIGQSCAKFMEQIKLNQASEQLILTSRSAQQVSDDLGYIDDTTFRRAFKRVTGFTPGQYRQKFKH